MRIAFVLPDFDEHRNSFSKLLYPVATALLAAGHELRIYSGNRAYHGALQAYHVCVKRLRWPLGVLDNLALVVLNTWHTWRDHRRQRFDIVHNLGCGSTLMQNVVTAHACHAAWVERKSVYGEQWLSWLNPAHWLTLAVEAVNYRRPLGAVIAVSHSVAAQLLRFHPSVKPCLRVVENGLYTSLLPEAAAPGTPVGFSISFVSNDHRKKGLVPLLKALQIAQSRGLDWRLVVLGHDPQQAAFALLAQSLGVGERVEFKGHVGDVIGAMRQTQVFCSTSRYESFGMMFLEAARAGLPIVATEEGVYPELMHGFARTQVLTHPPDEQQLFAALHQIASDPTYARRLAAHIQAKAAVYTEERMVVATLAVYQEVLAGAGRPTPKGRG